MSNVTGFSNTQKIKEEAAIWLLKMEQESGLSDEEVKALRQWVSVSDTHRQVIIRMSKTWGDMDVLSVMMAPPPRRIWSSWDLLRAWLISPVLAFAYAFDKAIEIVSQLFRPKVFAAFCSVIVVSLSVWFLFSAIEPKSNTYTTAMGEQARHTLEDGSTLWLNTNTQVEVHYSDTHRRIRLLSGEAHFDVIKDAARPFEVYSKNRLVRALGTAFSVHRLEDRIEVFVSEGKVELAIVSETLVLKPDDYPAMDIAQVPAENHAPADKEIVLPPDASEAKANVTNYIGELVAGQSISIPTETDSLDIKVNESSVSEHNAGEVIRKLSWLDGKLVFAGESLEEVVNEISRYTPIRIDVTDPVLKEMRIGGHFEAGDTDALFFVLESGFGINVNKISENHVELLTKK